MLGHADLFTRRCMCWILLITGEEMVGSSIGKRVTIRIRKLCADAGKTARTLLKQLIVCTRLVGDLFASLWNKATLFCHALPFAGYLWLDWGYSLVET